MKENYVGKWVVVCRSPNNNNSRIGKLKCIYVINQTANRIYGTESKGLHGYNHHFNKNEIVRIINENDVSTIRQENMKLYNRFHRKKEKLEKKFQDKINDLSKGTKTTNINIEKEFWKSIKKAAKESKWIPEDYYMNDWVSDICRFLKEGINDSI